MLAQPLLGSASAVRRRRRRVWHLFAPILVVSSLFVLSGEPLEAALLVLLAAASYLAGRALARLGVHRARVPASAAAVRAEVAPASGTPIPSGCVPRRTRTSPGAERHPRQAERRSSGCVFPNPDGAHAARAIKGQLAGGAGVPGDTRTSSSTPAGRSAADVRAQIEFVAERVHAHSGLRLDPEIGFIPTKGAAPR